jgi:very-short-patch-repair endonuclease
MALMGASTHQQLVWDLVRRQHGVIAHAQLVALGYTAKAIKHRIAAGRLHPVYRGAYAVGRRELSREGEWMAAVLACGPNAALSHGSGATLLGIANEPTTPIHVSSLGEGRSRDGITVHRRTGLDTTTIRGIRTTTPVQTLIDLAREWPPARVEAAINEADRLELICPDRLRRAAERSGRQGARLRRILDRQTFRLTESELERRFLRLVHKTSLPTPETQVRLGRYRVDFFWRPLSLVVETDGARFHRTAAQQTRDRAKDQWLTANGMTVLRFTHAQVVYEAEHVATTLRAVMTRSSRGAPAPRG